MNDHFDKPTIRDRIYAIIDFIEITYLILCIIAAICIVVYALL